MRALGLMVMVSMALVGAAVADDAPSLVVYDARDLSQVDDLLDRARAVVGERGTVQRAKGGLLLVRATAAAHRDLRKALDGLRREHGVLVSLELHALRLSGPRASLWRRALRRRGTRHGADGCWSAPLSTRALKALKNAGEAISAPRVTAVDGQRAQVALLRQVAYVARFEVAKGVADPVIETLQLGWTFELTAWTARDRRSVALRLGATQARAGEPFPRVSTPHGEIACPEVSTRSSSLLMTLPDGGARVVFGVATEPSRPSRCPVLRSIGVRRQAETALIVSARLVTLADVAEARLEQPADAETEEEPDAPRSRR